MPYILTKTNGQQLTIVQDASVDQTTDLSFVGKNYAGYGKIVDQNFLYLLENFANTTQPSKAVQGQLWFNSATKTLNVSYNGVVFKQLSNIATQSTEPTANRVVGDLWWDTTNSQLQVFNGIDYTLVGPPPGEASQAYWSALAVPDITNTVNLSILQSFIDTDNVAVISNADNRAPGKNYGALGVNWLSGFQKGITLLGADPVTGSSTSTGYYFWGTAAESLTIANGTPGQLVYQIQSGETGFIGPGVAGQILVSRGTLSPQYRNTSSIYVGYATNAVRSTNIRGGVDGDLVVQSSTGTTSFISIGSTNTVLKSDGTMPVWGSASPSRVVLVGTTSVLAPLASANLTIVGFKGYALYSMATSSPAWVVVYTSPNTRTADSSRAITVDPTPGRGVIAEVITTVGSLVQNFTPAVCGYVSDTGSPTAIQLKVSNRSTSSVAITVTLTLLQLES
jgi:hypothetical protein